MSETEHPSDEILWLDEDHTVVTEPGQSQRQTRIIFADGSILEMTVILKDVMLDTAPDRTISANDLWTLTDYNAPDDPTPTPQPRAHHTASAQHYRSELIRQLRDTVPEHSKRRCVICHGRKRCIRCQGAGCDDCRQRGHCSACHGRGVQLVD